MSKIVKNSFADIKEFLSLKMLDALVPPIIYIIANNLFGLKIAIIMALTVAVMFAAYRIFKKEKIFYALGGIAAVAGASGLALLTDDAADYFLPKIIGSGALFLAAGISVLVGKPLAIIVSHLSRGWDFDWYLRDDIKPAYREVTIVWAVLLFIRMVIQIILYQRGDLAELGWASILLGFPATVIVLILTLIYGVWRLQKLGGPSIKEFKKGEDGPWEGQKKGF